MTEPQNIQKLNFEFLYFLDTHAIFFAFHTPVQYLVSFLKVSTFSFAHEEQPGFNLLYSIKSVYQGHQEFLTA